MKLREMWAMKMSCPVEDHQVDHKFHKGWLDDEDIFTCHREVCQDAAKICGADNWKTQQDTAKEEQCVTKSIYEL